MRLARLLVSGVTVGCRKARKPNGAKVQ
jgi:hypothetical protein